MQELGRRLSDILEPANVTARDVENYLSRVPLHTKYAPTIRGKARLFARDNVKEIALLKALSKLGFSLSEASTLARICLMPNTGGAFEWVLFQTEKTNHLLPMPDLDLERIQQTFPDETSFTLLHVGKILRRIDALFDQVD